MLLLAVPLDGGRFATIVGCDTVLGVLLFLTDFTAMNGATEFWPGSHLIADDSPEDVRLPQARAAGLPAYEGYGLSECASVVALNTPHADRPGSVGRALPHLNLTVAELRVLVTALARSPRCAGLHLTIYDPDLDPEGSGAVLLADLLTDCTGFAQP